MMGRRMIRNIACDTRVGGDGGWEKGLLRVPSFKAPPSQLCYLSLSTAISTLTK
jgi:hypothetical protein